MNRLYSSILILLIITGWGGNAIAQIAFPVPNIPGVCGVSGVIVNMKGGSGGASNSSGTGFPDGGAGGLAGSVVCTLNVAAPVVITSLTYYVGMQGGTGVAIYTGTTGAAGGTGYGHGGNGGTFVGPSGGVGTDVSGGAGGGSSAVLNTTGSTVLLVAAGGGGGGALSSIVTGGAGGATGAAGGSDAPNYGGSGGTPGSFGAAGGAGIAYAGSPGGAADPGNGGNGGEGLTGSQSGGGGGAGYGGGAGGGAGNTTALGVNTVTAGGGGGANYVAPTAITTSLTNGTATVAGNGAVSLVLYPAIATVSADTICTGGTTTFTETTPGGTWSSSDASIATVSSTTGMSITVTGISQGTVNISYTASAGYWSFVTLTVRAGASPIQGLDGVCATQSIVLTDTTAGGTWSSGSTGVASISSTGVVTGIAVGTTIITYSFPSGCNATTPITVSPFPDPIGGTLAVCVGNTTLLTDDVTGGSWSSLNTSIATIDPASGIVSGVSTGATIITYGFSGGCITTANFVVNPLPNISAEEFTNPTSCGGFDGIITLDGLTPGRAYIVNYDHDGTPGTAITTTANTSGQVGMNVPNAGLLDSGTYTNIYVTDVLTGCVSPVVGPVILNNPPNPPAPIITSNPICLYQTLFLGATDYLGGGTYNWTGPNGFTSTDQNPYIISIPYTDTGIYSVTYTLVNCISAPATADISIQSPPQLQDMTPDQTIPYGGSIRLNVDNAFEYMWVPDNGTLSNPNINNPIATPIVTTTYTVVGMSQYGCRDSLSVTITVDTVMNGVIPTAFTPNNDGRNDIFHPVGSKFKRLIEFRVYNRWGQEVFYSNSIDKGWDGTYNGTPQDMGIYYYQIIVAQPEGANENTTYTGSVTLIR